MDINKCYEFMKDKHKGQKRIQGTEYYTHPEAVSNILKEKGFGVEYQVAGLFHDLLEDTDATEEEIVALSSKEVLTAVKLVTKEKGYIPSEYISRIKENEIARMVKLADRMHNLSETHLASKAFQKKYIEETKSLYLDLAKDTVFEDEIRKILHSLENTLLE